MHYAQKMSFLPDNHRVRIISSRRTYAVFLLHIGLLFTAFSISYTYPEIFHVSKSVVPVQASRRTVRYVCPRPANAVRMRSFQSAHSKTQQIRIFSQISHAVTARAPNISAARSPARP